MDIQPAIPSVQMATAADIDAIAQVSLDYVEGWFTADSERIQRALHPDLVKRTIWHDLEDGTWKVRKPLTAEAMVDFTRRGGGSWMPESEKVYEVTVLDVFRHIATVKVSSYPYMDYLHLAKIDDRWWIINCLYEARQGETNKP